MSRSLLLFPLIFVAAFLSLKGPSLVYSDAADYLIEAHKLWNQGASCFTEGFLHRYWKPTFFPLWSSLFFFPAQGSLIWGSALSLLSGLALFIFSLHLLLKRFLSHKEALVLTTLIALQAPFLSTGLHFMSEGWALSFWALSLALYLSPFKGSKLYSGLSLGLGGMISPVLTGLYFLPFYVYLLLNSEKTQKKSSLFLLWPLLPLLAYASLFYRGQSFYQLGMGLVLILVLAPLTFKNCPRDKYLFLSLSLLLPFLWYASHLPMLWDWVYLSSFSPYAEATGKFSLQRFKEYQSYLELLPLCLSFLWLTLGLFLFQKSHQRKKERLLLTCFISVPLFLALATSANGDLRYFKWPFFLLLVGLILLSWPTLKDRFKRIVTILLVFSSLLSCIFLWETKNHRLGQIKTLHQEILLTLPDKATVGMIPLGTQDNDILQSRAIFQFLSYQKGKKQDFNFLDERSSDSWNKKDFIIIGPCENQNEKEPSLPLSSKEFSKYCPDFPQGKNLHFVIKKNDSLSTIKIIELSKSLLP